MNEYAGDFFIGKKKYKKTERRKERKSTNQAFTME